MITVRGTGDRVLTQRTGEQTVNSRAEFQRQIDELVDQWEAEGGHDPADVAEFLDGDQ